MLSTWVLRLCKESHFSKTSTERAMEIPRVCDTDLSSFGQIFLSGILVKEEMSLRDLPEYGAGAVLGDGSTQRARDSMRLARFGYNAENAFRGEEGRDGQRHG